MILFDTFLYINNTKLQSTIKEIYEIRYKIFAESRFCKTIERTYKYNLSNICIYWFKKNKFKFLDETYFTEDCINGSDVKKAKIIIDFDFITEGEEMGKSLIVCGILVQTEKEIECYAVFDITNARLVVFRKGEFAINSKPLRRRLRMNGVYDINTYFHAYVIAKRYGNLYDILFEERAKGFLEKYLQKMCINISS